MGTLSAIIAIVMIMNMIIDHELLAVPLGILGIHFIALLLSFAPAMKGQGLTNQLVNVFKII